MDAGLRFTVFQAQRLRRLQPVMVPEAGKLSKSKSKWRAGRRTSADAVLAAELVDAATGVDDLLLARVKRMARRTNFDTEVLTQRRAGCEFVATTTSDFDFPVVGMNLGFHLRCPWKSVASSRQGLEKVA
jgi:hypothetical protein